MEAAYKVAQNEMSQMRFKNFKIALENSSTWEISNCMNCSYIPLEWIHLIHDYKHIRLNIVKSVLSQRKTFQGCLTGLK